MEAVYSKAKRVVAQLNADLERLERDASSAASSASPSSSASSAAAAAATGDGAAPISLQGAR